MRVSLFCGADLASVHAATDRVRLAADHGFDGAWFAQGYNLDALTAVAVCGASVPGIALGTAVVPIQGRHPIPLALAALTASDAAGAGRVTLGVGVTHKMVSEGAFGVPYREAVTRCRDVLVALHGLLGDTRSADYDGPTLSAHATFPSAGMPSPGLVVAALGPKMLELAGEFADGTVTWMTGPATLSRDVVPRLADSAARFGRDAPVVVAGLPVCLTDDVAGARTRVGGQMAGAASLPSYRRMLASEGVAEPVDIALVGGPDELAAGLDRLADAGVSELLAYVQGTEAEQRRTVEELPGLAHQLGSQ